MAKEFAQDEWNVIMIAKLFTLVTVVSLFGCILLIEPTNAGRLASDIGFHLPKTDTVTPNNERHVLASNHKKKGSNKGKMKKRKASHPYSYYEAKGLFETG